MNSVLVRSGLFNVDKIINSDAFRTLEQLGLASIKEEQMVRYGTKIMDVYVPSTGGFKSHNVSYGITVHGLSGSQSLAFGRVACRRIAKSQIAKTKGTKVRKTYVVIDLSPKNLINLGIIGGEITTAVLASPLVATIVGAVGSIIMSNLQFKPIFRLAPDYALFFSYLVASNFNSLGIKSVDELKNIFNSKYKTFISNEYPDIKLSISFDNIYAQLINTGILYTNKKQMIQLKSTIKIINMNVSFEKARS